jgi:ribosomal protein L11 methyltransferase
MRTWPAIEVSFTGADESRPDLFLAALVDLEVAAIDDNAAALWRVFFHSSDARDRALDELRAFSPAAVDVPDDDWAARSQASLRAVQVGHLVIAPPWDASPEVMSGFSRTGTPTRTIVIQPSMGFGTGHHATTRLCLAALQATNVRRRSVLDVGTGSGVLAIAAYMLGARPVLAIDDDPDAVQAARENAALNHGTEVELRVADLRDPLHSGSNTRFDLLLANLTGGLLIHAAGRLHDLTTPGGTLILSGFMQHEAAGVLAAFGGCGVRGRAEEDEWVCVTLEKSSSS